MAEKRMINKSISISEQVNGLPTLFDKLLFTWMIPHSDDFGRMPGSPPKLKALVVPMLEVKLKDVEQALQNMHTAGLIIWYEVDGDKYIQFPNFENHQTGLHKRTKSKFPEFPGSSENYVEIPSQQNRTELNRTEQKRREGNRTEQEGKLKFADSVSLSQSEYDKLIQEYGKEFTDECIQVLDNYKVANGKNYKSDYRAMLNWVVERVKEKATKPQQRSANVARFPQKPVLPVVKAKDKPEATEDDVQRIMEMAKRMNTPTAQVGG
jgi:hypothetical protein